MGNSILRRGASQPSQPMTGLNPNMVQQLQQFKNTFNGNPKQMVMNMLQQGKITNPQLQQVMQMAQQFKGILK